MTQPAKVQEPSMEEILASIRRIIADDEAKPPAAEKPASAAAAAKPEKPAAKAPVMNDVPPSAIPAAQAAAAKAATPPPAKPAPPPPPPPPAAAAVSNSQDDIDALLNGLCDERIRVDYITRDGRETHWFSRYEGALASVMRRYSESESEGVREKLEEYMAVIPCKTCGGTRLKPEILAVTVGAALLNWVWARRARTAT